MEGAAETAYESMSHAALGLFEETKRGFPEDPDSVLARFPNTSTTRNCSLTRSSAASSLSTTSMLTSNRGKSLNAEQAQRLVEEAQLFLEACHACYAQVLQQPAVAVV